MSLGEFLGSGSTISKGIWHLNGNSLDQSGNGYNGTDTAISYVAGKLGNCASFNGTSSKIRISPLPAGLTMTDSYTVSFWMKPTATTNFIYAMGNSSDADQSVTWSSNKLQIGSYYTDNIHMNIVATTNTLSTGVWYHVVCVRERNVNLRIYIDGALACTPAAIGNTAAYYGSGTKLFTLGQRGNAAGTYYSGLLDEVIIENVARDAVKVKKYYTYAKGRFGNL